jgi:uncharacterized protein YkwD
VSRNALAAHIHIVRTLTACAAGVLVAIAATAITAPSGAGAQTTARVTRQAARGHRHAAKRAHSGHAKKAAHRHGRRHHARKRGHGHTAVKHIVHHARSTRGTGVAARGTEDASTVECANTTLAPEPGDMDAVREATLCLINRERVTRGERALRLDSKLVQAAQGHSESMATDDYFAHDGPDGSTPLSRMRAAGYIYSSRVGYEVGENIAWGTLGLATPKAIVESWMSSPGHRANILDANYRDTGIGVTPHVPTTRAEDQSGAIYTQDFGVIIAG